MFQHLLRRAALAGACVAGILLPVTVAPVAAEAAPGDLLASFDASATAGIPGCGSGVGTGIAYDGDSLLLSCMGSNVIERVDAVTHLNNGPLTIAGVSDLGALAFDAGRNRLWACQGYSNVVAINLTTSSIDASIPSFPTSGCFDGLAYDGSDDTIWSSADASPTTQHYSVTGTPLGSFSNAAVLPSCPSNSGIAVGGDDLYLANNGCSQIWRSDKTLTSSTMFASFPRRLEDLECDNLSFPGADAIWVQDAYDRELQAYAIEEATCLFGGAAGGANAEGYAVRARVDALPLDTAKVSRSAASLGEAPAASAIVSEGVPAVVQADVLTSRAETTSDEDANFSAASSRGGVASVDLLDGTITADAVMAKARATFDGDDGAGTTSSAGSGLVNAVVNGTPIPATVPDNTTIAVPGVGTLVLNEVITTSTPDGVSVQVNVIHFTSDDGKIEVVVGSAFAGAGSGYDTPDNPSQVGLTPPTPPDPSSVGGSGVAYTEGFETGAAGWTFESAPGTTADVWKIGVPTGGPGSAAGGAKVAATNLAGPMPENAAATLVSPPIALPADGATLSTLGQRLVLRHQQWFEGGVYAGSYYLQCGDVSISVSGGPPIALTPVGGYPQASPYCDNGPGDPAAAYAGDLSGAGWQQKEYDLTAYAGQSVNIRFRALSYYNQSFYTPGDGWYLDDVFVGLEALG
ncbi:MAG TPA: choice-of-anchor P family protein [Acidimicrobiales bacterium]|nr:choice-of-anchor P family protein [Acidimicrobiales bacterium]